MSIELTNEQRRAVEAAREPVRVLDPQTRHEYVLLRAEAYERLRRLAEAEVVDPSFYEFDEPQAS